MTILTIEHISSDPNILGGKPVIRGRRIPVHHVVYAYQQGAAIGEIMQAHDLTAAQVHAALAYYYDHVEQIDALIRAEADLNDAEPSPVRARLIERWQAQHGHDPTEEITVREVADRYGISPQAVRKACAEGRIAARKSGSTWLIQRLAAHQRWGDASATT